MRPNELTGDTAPRYRQARHGTARIASLRPRQKERVNDRHHSHRRQLVAFSRAWGWRWRLSHQTHPAATVTMVIMAVTIARRPWSSPFTHWRRWLVKMVTMVRERQVDCHRNGIKIEIPPRRCRRGRPESSRDVPSVLLLVECAVSQTSRNSSRVSHRVDGTMGCECWQLTNDVFANGTIQWCDGPRGIW